MEIELFVKTLAEICARSKIADGRRLEYTIIINPSAGGFTIRSRWKKHRAVLEEYGQKALANPARKASPSAAVKSGKIGAGSFTEYGAVLTGRSGHAGEITKAVIDEALSSKESSPPFQLIICAGGDGTSWEVLSALHGAPARFRSSCAVLRLPLGTGNDGADSPVMEGALDLLIKPVNVEYTPALRLVTAQGGPARSKGPFLAFNILSAGLDAFVTHMTNKMKGKLPGDSYKLWVDIAALFYDRLYKVDYINVKAFNDKGKEVNSFREKLLLLAVGASGYRTYGSGNKILPDGRNVCAVKQMPLLRKIALKDLFGTGEHIDKPESILFNAHKVEFSSIYPLLAQMDGEAVLLERDDFPASIELTEPLIPLLKIRKNV
ncbi:MAG: diacylglycerol kinase [Treponema sp.]|jgi:diacylglycerol kinase family enzyme|nr:diacylglycerol kinase [Treponema sp.]